MGGEGDGGLRVKENFDLVLILFYVDVLIFWGKGGV